MSVTGAVGLTARHFYGIPFQVRQVLLAGGVIAYPTEGVYGIGCDARIQQAIKRVVRIKARADDKGLILIASDAQQLAPWIACPRDLDARQHLLSAIAEHPDGRATTWVVPASERCSPLLTGNRATIAVRVTRHADAANLCRAVDGALISTSANISGRNAITQPARLRRQFGKHVDAVLARAGGGQRRPSRVIDYASGNVLRD
ncbi:MAG: L-threonylcarbamoyladenylate synthase [Pseudomonadota bacterium]